MTGWSSFAASAAIAAPTSANDETTSRGATLNQGRWLVRPRSRSMTGCGLKTPFVIASATKRVGVERDLELLAQLAGERGVQEGLRP